MQLTDLRCFGSVGYMSGSGGMLFSTSRVGGMFDMRLQFLYVGVDGFVCVDLRLFVMFQMRARFPDVRRGHFIDNGLIVSII